MDFFKTKSVGTQKIKKDVENGMDVRIDSRAVFEKELKGSGIKISPIHSESDISLICKDNTFLSRYTNYGLEKVGLDHLVEYRGKRKLAIIRYTNDPDLFYKIPKDTTLVQSRKILMDSIWIILDRYWLMRDSGYNIITGKELLKIADLELRTSRSNENRGIFRNKKTKKIITAKKLGWIRETSNFAKDLINAIQS